jgi:DNA-binding Xre family transcriptional regulator
MVALGSWVMPAQLRWTLKDTLQRHGISMYKLVEQSELTKRTVYENLAQGKATRVDVKTLEKILSALEVLLERKVEIEQVFVIDWVD